MILLWGCRCTDIRRLFGVLVVAMLACGTVQQLPAHAETKILPSASVQGLYSSNIYNRPKELLEPGTEIGDFLSTVRGDVGLQHVTRDIDASLQVGGSFNAYVENTNRNFATMNVGGYADLDRWVDQYFRGASLSVTETFRYTPEPPGFLTGVRDRPEDDTFFGGVQGFRATSLINSTSVLGRYPVSRDISLEGGYRFGLRHQGKIQGGDVPGVNYFDTMTHTLFGGPRYKLTRNDSVAALYRYTFATQTRSDGGSREFSTNIVSLAGEYHKDFPMWNFTVQGGMTLVEPGGRSFPSGTLRITTRPEQDTVFFLQLVREGKVSFYLQGGATINNRAMLGFSHKIYERLMLDGFVGYTFLEYLPDTRGEYKYALARSRLSYKVTRNITASFLYIYSNTDNDTSSVQYQVSRHQVGFMLTTAWDLLAGDLGIGGGSGDGM